MGKARAATTDSTPFNETEFAAHFTRSRRVDDLWRDSLDVQPGQSVDDHIGDEPHNDGIKEKETITENESCNEYGNSRPTHDEVCRLTRAALEKHEETRLRRQIDDRCKNVLLGFFEEAYEQAKRNAHTAVFEVMDEATVEDFFTEGAYELLDYRMYKLA